MTTLHAQPYDMSVQGFSFTSIEQYDQLVRTIKNCVGDPVEEFEIQFIDGDELDCEMAKAIGLHQGNIQHFLTLCEELPDIEKLPLIIAVGECGYQFDENTNIDDIEIDVYAEETLEELAILFVDEGLFGEIPERLQYYIDYSAIARDLSADYTETIIAGEKITYRCG